MVIKQLKYIYKLKRVIILIIIYTYKHGHHDIYKCLPLTNINKKNRHFESS